MSKKKISKWDKQNNQYNSQRPKKSKNQVLETRKRRPAKLMSKKKSIIVFVLSALVFIGASAAFIYLSMNS